MWIWTVLLLLAQTTEAAHKEAAFTVSGTVLDAVTGTPLAGVQVTVQRYPISKAKPVAVLTDEAGEFAFRELSAGAAEFAVSKKGYAKDEDSNRLLERVATQHLTFLLEPQGALSGEVADRDGDKLVDAEVRLLRKRIQHGRAVFTVEQFARSNDLGAFRFHGLSPGMYIVCAAPAASEYEMQNHRAYKPVCAPNAGTQEMAQVFRLGPGDEQHAAVTAALGPSFEVRGRFNSSQVVRLHLRPTDSDQGDLPDRASNTVDWGTGAFTFRGVPQGEYSLTAEVRRKGVKLTANRTVRVKGADVTDADLTLAEKPDFALTGVARVTGGAAVSKALSGFGVTGRGYSSEQVMEDDGKIEVEEVEPGEYRLRFEAKPGFYVAAVMQNGRDIQNDVLTLGGGDAQSPLEVVVSPHAASIRAAVTWPESGRRRPARVIVLQARAPHEGAPQEGAPQEGAPQEGASVMNIVREMKVYPPEGPLRSKDVAIESLAPGAYSVYAWSEPVEVEYAVLAALQPYRAFERTVTLSENDRQSLTLPVVDGIYRAN